MKTTKAASNIRRAARTKQIAGLPEWIIEGIPRPRRETVMISDLSVCTPRTALWAHYKKGRWKLLPYTIPTYFGWQVSRCMPKPNGGIAKAVCIGFKNCAADWTPFKGNPNAYSFYDLHARFGNRDGIVYLARQLNVAREGEWELALGHDGGARMFVDGACVLTEPLLRNPAVRGRSCARIKLARGVHEIVVVMDLAAGNGWGIFFQEREVNTRPAPLEFRDLSSGKGLCALVNTGAPEITLPLNAKGWHAIYLGLVGSNERDMSNAIKIKLTGDDAYQHRSARNGWSEEVLFKVADLTGQDLQIAQQSAGSPRAACLCYVKLVPLSDREARAVQRDREQRVTRRMIGTIDGFSFMWERNPKTKAEVLEEFEPFRDTDFGTIWWQISGADLVNYRSKHGTITGKLTEDYPRDGDGYYYDSVKTLIRRGINLTRLAVETCRKMGIQIHVSMRPAAWKGPYPYDEYFLSKFYLAHPEWRCRDIDGTPVTRMSFAVPEVRRHLLDVFLETLEAEPDGVNILYTRGVPLILWEDAFCDSFKKRYGVDARLVPEDDPRLYDLRAEIMTQWMREVRQLLDGFRKKRGLKQRLAISAMCRATEEENRQYGLDVARWVREGLIDQIGIDPYNKARWTSGEPDAVGYYKRITAGSNVSIHPGMEAAWLPKPEDVLKQAVKWYDAGVNGFLFWDPSCKVSDGLLWPVMSNIGHEKYVRARVAAGEPERVVPDILGVDDPPCRWSAWAGF